MLPVIYNHAPPKLRFLPERAVCISEDGDHESEGAVGARGSEMAGDLVVLSLGSGG